MSINHHSELKGKVTFENLVSDPLFIKWVKEEDPSAGEYWTNWLNANPGMSDLVEEARIFLELLPGEEIPEPSEISDIADRIVERASELEKVFKAVPSTSSAFSTSWVSKLQKVAAVIGFLFVTGLAVYSVISAAKWIGSRMDLVSVTNHTGQPRTVLLPDSSVVMLNVDSRLEYHKKDRGKSREVSLTGEAFFDIRTNPNRPFVVNANDVLVTVPGTEFNVSNYSDDERAEVTVIEGYVVVSGYGQEGKSTRIPVRSNEKLVYHKANHSWIVNAVDTDIDLLWKKGIMHFDHAPLTRIIRDLERWYNVEITLDVSINQKTYFTGRFNNSNLENILDGICFSLNCTYELEGDKVIIRE